MYFIHNQQEIPIDEKADIIIEKFSPIINLDLKGEYALSFNNPITPELQQAMGFSNLPNVQNPVTKIPVALFDDNLLFMGDLTTKVASPRQYQQELTTTPGGVPLDIWKRKITEIDFGKDTIPTTTVETNIHRLPMLEAIGTTSSNSNKYTFGQYIGYKHTVLKIFMDGTEVYSHTFAYPGNASVVETRDDELDKVVAEFNSIQASNSFGGILERNSDEWLIKFPSGISYVVTATIRVDRTSTPFTVNYAFNRISYQSIGTYFDAALTSGWAKPYLLPQIYAPNLYSDKNPAYNGNINAINVNKYYYNTEDEPAKYTFVPVFQFSYLIQKLMEYMGYTLDGSFFATDNNDKLYWLTMVCADRQFPNLTKSFNIHANEIIYKDYLPEWTVQEFINNFQNWQNVYFDFDIFSKIARIIRRQEPFESPTAQEQVDLSEITDDNYSLQVESFDSYQVKFAITDSDDESLKNDLFKPYPNEQTTGVTWQEVLNNFAPLIFSTNYVQTTGRTGSNIQSPVFTGSNPWDWSSNNNSSTGSTVRSGILVCYQGGKSTMFGLSNETAKSRSLFCSIESNTIVTENTIANKSLFIDGSTGLYEKQWKKYFEGISENIIIQANVVLNKLKLHQFNYKTIFHAFGCGWLASQISVNPRLKISKIRLRRIKV